MQKKLNYLLTVLLATGLLHVPLGATLLVYEGFSGYNEGALLGQEAQGLGLTGEWARRGNINTNVSATGLTFGSLVTTGGAAAVNLPVSSGDNRLSVMGVELDLASAVTGTLYSSMLFNFESVGNHSSNLASMRVSDNIGIQTNNRLATWPVSQGETTYNPGVSYGASANAAGQTLTFGETYMAISIFTNVGTTLSVENPGVASMYVLSEAQFEDFVANGRSEVNLTGRGTGSGVDEVFAFSSQSLTTGTFHFADGNFLGLSSFIDSGSGSVTGTYDELRWGTSLDSITVIPEPGTLILVGLSLMALAISRRRR